MIDSQPSAARPNATDPDQINLAEVLDRVREFAQRCRQRRKLFFKIWLGCVVLTVLYVAGRTPDYRASTRILPYKQADAALNGISGLASLAGVSIPSSSPAHVVSADLYPEVANSLLFRVSLARAPLRFTAGTYTFEDYFDKVYSPRFIEGTWRLARRAKQAIFGSGGDAWVSTDSGAPVVYSESFRRHLREVNDRVLTTMDRKTSIITITVDMPDAVAAADLARLAASQLTREIIVYESRKATEVAAGLREQQVIAEKRYRESQRAFLDFKEGNRIVGLRSEADFQRLEIEYMMAVDLYKSVSTQLEIARVRQQEDTPVLTVLEPSIVPNSPASPRKVLTLFVLLLLGTIAGAGFLLLEPFLNASRRAPAFSGNG